MNIECKTEQLKHAVHLADKMTGKNLSLPSLQSILLVASGSSLKIRSTNLAVGIEIEIPARITVEGSVLVKGDILSNVCASVQVGSITQDITLSHENDNLLVSTASSKTVIKCVPSEDFPTLPTVEGESFDIKASSLSEGIRSVSFCCSVSDIKPEIASIFVYTEQDTLIFVATDSFRLAEKKLKVKAIPEIAKILIPYKSITDVLRVLDTISDTVHVSFTRNQLSLSTPEMYFTTRLIDGAFPDYKLIVPKEEKTRVVVMKNELLSTLKLSTIFADKFFQVQFAVSLNEKQIRIDSKNSDVGSSISTIDAVIEGVSIDVSFNLKYFLDVFGAITSDSVSISFTEAHRPIIIRPITDTSFMYLLMPTNK